MKAITTIALCLLSVSAFGFVPKTQTPLEITTDSIYLKDKANQKWQTQTDCLFNLKENSEVRVKQIDKRKTLRVNHRLIVSVDGERHICRITKLSTV